MVEREKAAIERVSLTENAANERITQIENSAAERIKQIEYDAEIAEERYNIFLRVLLCELSMVDIIFTKVAPY